MSKGAFKRIFETLTNNTYSNPEYAQKSFSEKTEATTGILRISDDTNFQLCRVR